VSGRLAVGRWQAQAIPHGHLIPEGATPVREMIGRVKAGSTQVRYDGTEYVTPVDRCQYEHDLAAGEMRVVVVIANCVPLWDALDAGADTHAMNAKALFGVDEAHPEFKQLRNGAKRATFGILYGGGVNAIHEQVEAATGMHFSKQSVADAKASFFESYPEFLKLTEQATWKVTRWQGGPGFLTMLDGWRRWYGLEEKTNSAVNQVIQGNLARAVNQWMVRVEREVPGCLLLQIHDSVITEHDDTPEGREEAQQVSDIGNEVLIEYFNVRGRVMHFGIEPEPWNAKS
jgi:DNA polymerase I-like protein with 3'-5' exonuclease and polymerase domains